jgi:Ca2+-binding EF-hand superfamily protein
MRFRIVPIILVALLVTKAESARAQSGSSGSFYGKMLERFDTNKDGKIKRSEIPEGTYRNAYDRMVEQFKLDPERTYDRKDLEKILGATDSSSSSSNGSSRSRPGSPGSPGSRSFGPRSFGTRPNGSNGDGRTIRTLGDLPSEYRSYDKDGDGQIGLYEWPKNRIAEFARLDLNDDGFLTLSELKQPSRGESKKESEPAKDSQPAEGSASDEKPATTPNP